MTGCCRWAGAMCASTRCQCVCHGGCGICDTVQPGSEPGLGTVSTRIPPEVLAEVERVLAFGATKTDEAPGQERWAAKPAAYHVAKALGHIAESVRGVTADHETGADPLVHALCRLIFACALVLRGRR